MQLFSKIRFGFLSVILVAGLISFSGFAEVAAVRTGETIELLVFPQTEVRAADFAMPGKSFSRDFLRKFIDFSFYSLLFYLELAAILPVPMTFYSRDKEPKFVLEQVDEKEEEEENEDVKEVI